ncbi:MAG: tetratricopeptide repeat protein, partial [Chloroflexota bacterium]
YSQHQIIQSFFYDQPRRSQRRAMHRSAAEYYEVEEPDLFLETFHNAKAEEFGRVARLIYAHVIIMMNLGRGKALQQAIQPIDIGKTDLSAEQRLAFLIGRGQLLTLLGELDESETDLQLAANMLNTLPQTAATDQLKAEVCLAMGQLLERQDPPKALEWAERGLKFIPPREQKLPVQLHLLAGMLNMYMGNFGAALESLQVALDDLPAASSGNLKVDIMNNLGATYWFMGQLDVANRFTSQALELSRLGRDHHLTAQVLLNSGPIKYLSGDWPGAIEALTEGLDIAERLGNHSDAVGISINLGACHLNSGNDDEAQFFLEKSLSMMDGKSTALEITAQIRLGELHYHLRQFEPALKFLEKAEALAAPINDQRSPALLYAIRSDILTSMGQNEDGMHWANQAITQSKMIGDNFSLGIARRCLGRNHVQRSEWELARSELEKSIQAFAEEGPHQIAISQIEMARLEHLIGRQSEALMLLQTAHATCSALGAVRELKKIEKMRHDLNLQ